MSKKRRMRYIGTNRNVRYNPWMKLVYGKYYDIEIIKTTSGKMRIRIYDDFDSTRENYPDKKAFEREWA